MNVVSSNELRVPHFVQQMIITGEDDYHSGKAHSKVLSLLEEVESLPHIAGSLTEAWMRDMPLLDFRSEDHFVSSIKRVSHAYLLPDNTNQRAEKYRFCFNCNPFQY